MRKMRWNAQGEIWRTVGVVALFALFTVGFFWRILFSNGVYFPIGGDFASFNFPQNLFGVTSLQRGEIPLWNPYVSAGRPYAADPNIGFFYPLKLLFAFAIAGFSYQEMEYLLILHYFLSGLTAYFLARDLGASGASGIIAGVAYMFSGFLIGQLEHPNIVISTTWLPLVFLFLRRAILSGRIAPALWAGIFLALSIFGGHQQFPLLMLLWMLIWLLGYWLCVTRRNSLRDSGLLVLTLLVAVAASAVQILPALELIGVSTRGQLSIAEATALNLPPLGWIMLVLPHFFGNNAVQAQSLWSGYGNLNEAYGYVGVVTLFLAAIGIAIRKSTGASSIRSYESMFLAAIAVIALLLAVGDLIPLYGWVCTLIPVLRFFRVPARFLYWFDLSLPLLAAFGMDLFIVAPTDRSRDLWRASFVGVAILVAVAALLHITLPGYHSAEEPQGLMALRINDLNTLIGLLAGLLAALLFRRLLRGSRILLPILVVILLLIDLLAAQGTYDFTTHDPLEGFRHPGVVNLLQRAAANSRVDSAPEAWVGWEPLTGLLYQVPMASGLPWEPFELTAFKEYSQAVNRDSQGYDFLSVKYLVAPRGMTLSSKWRLRPVGDPTVDVCENTQAMPRAFMVFRSIIEPDPKRTLEMIRRDQFDPSQTVLLESGIPISYQAAEAKVQIVSSSNDRVLIRVSSPQEGYLVMSDTYYPGWRVWIDQNEAELLRADYAFRAVFLRAGEHDVQFEFDPLTWRVGLWTTLAAWGALGFVGIAGAAKYLASGVFGGKA